MYFYTLNTVHFKEFTHEMKEDAEMEEVTEKLQGSIDQLLVNAKKEINEINDKSEIESKTKEIKQKRNENITKLKERHAEQIKQIHDKYNPN